MKNFFKKMKTYSFWVSFSGALIILVNALGRAFGFKVENQVIEDCIMSIAGILVVLGVVTMGDKKIKNDDKSGDDVLDENEEKSDSENDTIAEENGDDFVLNEDKTDENLNKNDKTEDMNEKKMNDKKIETDLTEKNE
mgnify:FL=1